MNFIEDKATNLASLRIRPSGLGDIEKLLGLIQKDLLLIDVTSDKLTYVTILLEANELAYSTHLETCRDKETCGKNKQFELLNYTLKKELRMLGVQTDTNVFSMDEKERLSNYLDKFTADLKDLKDGQQLMYDDLYEEIQELKKLFVLGKKNWRQLARGKVVEMVAGGVISTATAEPLLEFFKEVPKLL